MKTKLLLSGLLAVLLLGGCQSGSTEKNSANPTPPPSASHNPGNNNPDKGTPDNGNSDEGNPDNGNSDNGNPTPAPVTLQAAGWYMRTTVQATASDGKVYVHKTAGVFGALKDSEAGKDKHDINAFGKAALYVVFPQTDWGENNGDYFSDYRAYNPNSTGRQVWTFQVKNNVVRDGQWNLIDLRDATFTLALKGPFKVYKKKDGLGYDEVKDPNSALKNMIHLVDVDNDREYSYGEFQNEHFSMENRAARTFRWVIGSVSSEDYEDIPTPANVQDIAPASVKEEVKPAGKFGLPPAP